MVYWNMCPLMDMKIGSLRLVLPVPMNSNAPRTWVEVFLNSAPSCSWLWGDSHLGRRGCHIRALALISAENCFLVLLLGLVHMSYTEFKRPHSGEEEN